MLDVCDVKSLRELDPNKPGIWVKWITDHISSLDECLNVLNDLIQVYQAAAVSLCQDQIVNTMVEYSQFTSPTCRAIIRVIFGRDELPKLDDPMSACATLATLQAEIPYLRETKKVLEERYYEHTRFVKETLAEHKLVAGILEDTEETKQFIELVDDVSKLNGKSKHFDCVDEKIVQRSAVKPYVQVISSVGTGKTQLAFTLANHVPLIYILDFDTSSYEFSLGEIFKKSCGRFLELFEKDTYRAASTVEAFLYNERNKKFTCLGFLVSLWEEMIKVKGESMSWIEAQTSDRLGCLSFDPIDFHECAYKLNRLFTANRAKMGGHQPIFILDQLKNPDTRGVPGHDLLMLLRLTGLVTVVMGGGIDAYWTRPESEVSEMDCFPFCVITTKLPGYPPVIFEDKFERIRETLSNRRDISNANRQRIADLVDMAEKAIPGERPGFINCITSGLKLLAEGKAPETAKSPESLLQWITHHLHTKVCSKLNEIDVYSFAAGQARYAGFRGRHFRGWRECHLSFSCKSGHCCKDYYDVCKSERKSMTTAHKRHQAHETSFTAALQGANNHGSNENMVVGKNGCSSLNRVHVWGRFSDEPFSSLAFCTSPLTGPHSRNLALPNTFRAAILGEFVKVPEVFCPAALVHTLSAGGFRGQTASEWLPLFIFQVRLFGSVECEWESAELRDALREIKLPFCGPVDEPWNEHLFDYIQGKCKGAFLGTITQSSTKEDLGELLTVQANMTTTTTTNMTKAKIQCLCRDIEFYSDTVIPAIRKLISAESEFDVFLCSPPIPDYECHEERAKLFAIIKQSLMSIQGMERMAILYVTHDYCLPTMRTFNTIRLLHGDLTMADDF